MIGGNITAKLQVKDAGTKNSIGERVHTWTDVTAIKGWLDYKESGSQSDIETHKAKTQQTSHIFMCDFSSFQGLSQRWLWDPFRFPIDRITSDTGETVDATSENARIIIGGNIYQILLIDDPMGLHQHLEIYLKYVGGGLGV